MICILQRREQPYREHAASHIRRVGKFSSLSVSGAPLPLVGAFLFNFEALFLPLLLFIIRIIIQTLPFAVVT